MMFLYLLWPAIFARSGKGWNVAALLARTRAPAQPERARRDARGPGAPRLGEEPRRGRPSLRHCGPGEAIPCDLRGPPDCRLAIRPLYSLIVPVRFALWTERNPSRRSSKIRKSPPCSI